MSAKGNKTGTYGDDAPIKSKSGKQLWGRAARGGWTDSVVAGLMMLTTPWLPILFNVTIKYYKGSLTDSISALIRWFSDPKASLDFGSWAWFPSVTTKTIAMFAGWILYQFLLAVFLPGPMDQGQLTPAGNKLWYKVNGWRGWFITHALYIVLSLQLGLFNGGAICDEWLSLLMVAEVWGLFLTGFAWVKAGLWPSHPEDAKRSGSLLYDLFMGVELNPRFGNWFDFKLFWNGRPGIMGWTLFNFSFACKEYENTGTVSYAMIALNLLHATYVLDFFWNEGWYLRTIDIAHDHFGFYLAWGDTVWLPWMYTLQGYYLVYNPVTLSFFEFVAILTFGWAGYLIFRSVNDQKDKFRKSDPEKDLIWGKKPKYVRAKYQLADGTPAESLLLASGWWGLSRHFNYVGDLMLSFAYCLTCGFDNLLPYFYIIYMTILLVHRVMRDDSRCSQKYGEFWKKYCSEVRWHILPGVW